MSDTRFPDDRDSRPEVADDSVSSIEKAKTEAAAPISTPGEDPEKTPSFQEDTYFVDTPSSDAPRTISEDDDVADEEAEFSDGASETEIPERPFSEETSGGTTSGGFEPETGVSREYDIGVDFSYDSGGFGVLILLVAAVGLSTVLRLFFGGETGLGDAEAYYYAWARHPDLSYYDHPPGIAWLIRLGVGWLGDGVLGVRVLSIAAATGMALLLYELGRLVFSSRWTGFWAAALFLVTPAFFIGGVAAAPDPAFGFFWLSAMVLLFRAAAKDRPWELLPMGLAVGLGALCKYFMLLFWPSAILALFLTGRRKLLFSFPFLLAMLVSAIAFAPVLIWNAEHDWQSFAYHLIDRHRAAGFDPARFLVFLGGQFLYLSPVIAGGLFASLVGGFRFLFGGKTPLASLLFWFSFPVLAFFLFLGGWTGEAEPHWPLAGYLALYPLLAHFLLRLSTEESGFLPRLLTFGPFVTWFRPDKRQLAMGWLLLPAVTLNGLLLIHLSTDWFFPLIDAWDSAFPENAYTAKYDLSNELRGWDELGKRLEAEAKRIDEPVFVAGYHYAMCGQLTFALKDKLPVACLSRRTDAFDFFSDSIEVEGKTGLMVTDNRYDADPRTLWRCGGLEKLLAFPVSRAGRTVRTFQVWRCDGYKRLLREGETYEPPPVEIEAKPADSAKPEKGAPKVASPAGKAASPEQSPPEAPSETPEITQETIDTPPIEPAVPAAPGTPAEPEKAPETPPILIMEL